jgi:hypothetical protein
VSPLFDITGMLSGLWSFMGLQWLSLLATYHGQNLAVLQQTHKNPFLFPSQNRMEKTMLQDSIYFIAQ